MKKVTKKTTNRKKAVSLFSMITMIFVVSMAIGIAVNWNLFYLAAGFIPILIIGFAIIYLPSHIKKIHSKLSTKIDNKVSGYAKKLAK